MKKLIAILSILLVSYACLRDIDFDYNEVSSQVVVNSLFTEDEPWSVSLSYSKNVEDSTDLYIDNATVLIKSENETFSLAYASDGDYTSDRFPEAETTYTITVEVPGYNTVTASSSIPPEPVCTIESFDTLYYNYVFAAELCDYEVFPLTANLNSSENLYYRFVFQGYSPEYRYYLTQESIEILREEAIPEDILEVLSGLVGKYFENEYFFTSYTNQFIEEYGSQKYYSYRKKIHNQVNKEKLTEYDPEGFFAIPTFSNCTWLDNVSSYAYTIFGENKNNQVADILMGDQNLPYYMQDNTKQNLEYWLCIETCSPGYYQYYRSYIIQVSQRLNPYAETTEVYSNIENGLGIFAGYNQQKIHFYDY